MSIEKLDFNKVTQQSIPYTIFINSVIQFIDNLEALAIYVYLYSLPPNWNVNKEQLMNKFHIGDKKLRSIFSYLYRANLLGYQREKDKKTGKMIGTTIHILNGEKFDPSIQFKVKKTTEAKIASVVRSVDKTTEAIPDRVENRPSGFEGLQRKQKYKANKDTKKTKSSLKSENKKKHDFSESMDQMACEAKNIKNHETMKKSETDSFNKKDENSGITQIQLILQSLGIKSKYIN